MQSLGAVTIAQLKASVQVPKYKFEIYFGGAWIDMTNLGGANYLKDFSLSLGGAKMIPDPVAGIWSAIISNKDGMFYPANADSAYKNYFTTGRLVRLSIGGTFGGADVYWERLRGVMDSPSFEAIINGDVQLKGMDFMQYLADFKLKKPDNYWGSSTIISTLDPIEVLLAEIYAENDALEIGAGEAGSVALWTPSAGMTIVSLVDGGGGSTWVMKATLASGDTPTVDTYATAGAFQWHCPAGVLLVDAEVWAGGGGGAGADIAMGVGGGGGGAYSKKVSIAVIPGLDYAVIVGAAGAGGSGGPGSTPTVETFAAAGLSSWQCPAGVYFVQAELWGGGGGGGASDWADDGGGGGGGGAYSKKINIPVTPGTNYAYKVGAKGAGGVGGSGSDGDPGEDSYFVDVATALAKAGNGGKSAASGRAGGIGGSAASGVGDTKYNGGNGGAGGDGDWTEELWGGGGGGGSSAGTGVNGNNGANGTVGDPGLGGAGGAAPAGGSIGGDGGDCNEDGFAPVSGNSGGGGGAGSRWGGDKHSGGEGKCGKMILSYSISNSSNGSDGGDSYFVDSLTALAKGGKGGLTNRTGGAGGASASGVGDTKYSGGLGGSGYAGAGGGGGGGSSAGTAVNGNVGANGAGGAGGAGGGAPAGGGIGGVGGDPDTAGNVPISGIGGGGGGAGCDTTAVRAGGAGKLGKVVLSYVLPGTGSTGTVQDPNVGAITAGTKYKVVFKYKRVSGDGVMKLEVYVAAARQGDISGLATDAWTTATFYFIAADTGDAIMKFSIIDSGAGSEFRIDQMSMKVVSSTGILPRYSLPDDCTGVYYAVWDDVPIWYGVDPNGWFYDSVHNEFYFSPNTLVIAGTDNLTVYYHTAQIPIYVVADILVSANLYATRIAALLAMTYTEMGESIPRVWFEAGTSALAAIQKICEKCNFRFYFKYDGTPVCIPEPAIKGGGLEDAALEQSHLSTPEYYEDTSELYNMIAIDGEKIAQPIGLDQTMGSNYKGSDSDPTSITAYGERTKSISNHLFQSDAVCLAMATELLAIKKDPKKYFSFNADFNAIPLELGDTIRCQVRLAPGNGALWGTFYWNDGTLWGSNGIVIVHRGKIRDMKITPQAVNYICELAT